MLLKQYLEAIDYKITGGSDYTWNCFGPNARYLDSNQDEFGADSRYSISAVFDSRSQDIYVIELWDYLTDREYRWLNSEFAQAHNAECLEREIDPRESLDGRKFIDIEVVEDILEKITAVVREEPYDERVKVPVNFTDDELLTYMKLAHERDMTFNQFVEEALREAINDYKTNPEEFARRAESFKREKGIL